MAEALVHATCVVVEGVGLLLRGPSGSGKSDLALRLIDAGAALVADDQTRLQGHDGRLVARPPEVLAGRLEVRGLGILDVSHRAEAAVDLIVDLTPGQVPERLPPAAEAEILGLRLPRLQLDPFGPSAAAKLRLAARSLGALQQPGPETRSRLEPEIMTTAGATTSDEAAGLGSADNASGGGARPEVPAGKRLVLVTGLSGAGRSSVLKALEDQGFEAIDNLPLGFLAAVTSDSNVAGSGAGVAGRPVAIGIDTRTRNFAVEAFLAQLEAMIARPGPNPCLLFIDCDDEVLVRRFAETRRRHPLALDRPVADGIRAERRILIPLRARADLVIDSSELTLGGLQAQLADRLGLGEDGGMLVSVLSFSYRFGLPRHADLVFDVRFLSNPHYDPLLRPLTGRDEAVAAHVQADPGFPRFFNNLTELLEPLLPRYRREGKSYLTLAVGCTGGRHRSVAVAERLAAWLADKVPQVKLNHRDVGRSQAAAQSPEAQSPEAQSPGAQSPETKRPEKEDP